MLVGSAYLPGHVLGGRLVRKGDGWTERLMLRVVSALAVAVPTLVALALAGWFTVPAIVGSLLLCSGGCALAVRLLGERAAPRGRPGWWDLAAFGLAAGGFALYARPAEYVINLRDPGVYAVVADRLARTGELLHRDPLVGAVAAFHTFAQGRKYAGFYIYGEDLIVPQFFPGPFAVLGLGNLAGGLWGSLYVVPVLGALSVAVAFALGSELFGRWAGLVGAALLAVSYTQVWWARQPSSEVIAQLFILAGLWLAARFVRSGGDPIVGVMAGVLLGGAMLVRVDAFLAAAALPVLFGYDLLTCRDARRWLLPGVPLALFAGAALLYLSTVGGRYLNLIYSRHSLEEALTLLPIAVAAAIVVTVTLWAVRRRWGVRVGRWMEVRGGSVALVGALALVGFALWGYFLMPQPWESLPVASREFDAYRSQILVRLVWYTTPAVAVLGLAGLLLAARRLDAARCVFLGAVLVFAVLYVAVPNVAPDMPWATRRFVPAAFPGLCLLAGYAAVEAGRVLGRFRGARAGVALSAILVSVALGWTVHAAYPILGHRDLEGAVGAFERVARAVPEAEVVFVEGTGASTLEYVHGLPVLPYESDHFRRERDELREAGLLEDAVYVTPDGGPAPLLSDVEFREVAREEVSLPYLVQTEGHEPGLNSEVETLRLSYRVFRVMEEER